jgi:hypothetical protein
MREYVQELVVEVKTRMLDNAAISEEAFKDFIDQVVDEWLEYGQIHEDDDLECLKSLTYNMWETVKEELVGLPEDDIQNI